MDSLESGHRGAATSNKTPSTPITIHPHALTTYSKVHDYPFKILKHESKLIAG